MSFGRKILWQSVVFASIVLCSRTGLAQPEPRLAQELLTPIRFDKIPPTQFEFGDNQIKFIVNQSSAALIGVLDPPLRLNRISFEWKTTLQSSQNPAVEKTKAGDDFPLRIGLIIKGKAPLVPFFAPKWVKALKEILKHPSDRMLYLVLGSSQPPMSRWPSPYSDSIENLALAGTAAADGWIQIGADLPPLELVGYWLMADGDDQKTSFDSQIRRLRFN